MIRNRLVAALAASALLLGALPGASQPARADASNVLVALYGWIYCFNSQVRNDNNEGGALVCSAYSTSTGMTAGGLVAGFFFPPMSASGSAGVTANVALGVVGGGVVSAGTAVAINAASRKVLNQAARDARAYFDDRAQGLDGTLAQQVLELRERGLARGLSAEEVSDDALAEKIVELDQAISLAEAGQAASVLN